MAGTGPQDEIRTVLDEMLEAQNAGDTGRSAAGPECPRG